MINQKVIIFVLLFLLPFSSLAKELRGKVLRITDGDTIVVQQNNKQFRVRLVNIDAPERGQPYGRWATNKLKAIINNRPVTVRYQKKDQYNRILGRVYTAEGEVNREMVSQGAAWVYKRYNSDDALPALQNDAKANKRGLWQETNPVPPWEWRRQRR